MDGVLVAAFIIIFFLFSLGKEGLIALPYLVQRFIAAVSTTCAAIAA